jgi:hypothetical protein
MIGRLNISCRSAFGFGIDDVRFIQVGIIESSYIRTCKIRFKQGSVLTGFTVVCKRLKWQFILIRFMLYLFCLITLTQYHLLSSMCTQVIEYFSKNVLISSSSFQNMWQILWHEDKIYTMNNFQDKISLFNTK